MRIFLIGFMGSAKPLGARLASKLAYPFIDLDKVLEEHAGMSIREYFQKHGERLFMNWKSIFCKGFNIPKMQ